MASSGSHDADQDHVVPTRPPVGINPGVHPDDLARCLQVDAFDHALQAIPDGQLLALVTR